MTIPQTSNYPSAFDENNNLCEVHDGLRVRLAEDYSPGDTSITIEGDVEIIAKFPSKGFITLTEQCSDAGLRALSFYYNSKTDTTFDELEILTGFVDTAKPKRLTNVTQNVMAEHHNILKDAIIAIEKFVGLKGDTATKPKTGTLEARINFLRKIVLSPKAWFSVSNRIGVVPFTVEFKDLSFRLGTDGTSGKITYIWDFGDNTDFSSISNISVTDEVPSSATNVLVYDLDGQTVKKTYTVPGIYDVSLTVINDFGQNTVVLPDLISARINAPDEAVMEFVARTTQIETEGDPLNGPYETIPTIRTVVNNVIDIEVPTGENPNTGLSYGGELLDEGGSPIDPIVKYTWSLSDDLLHSNAATAKALYSVGGLYDIVLRVDTETGSYRITTYEDAIDVVEKTNLWLWKIKDNVVSSYEFGLISETFKKNGVGYAVDIDDSFLDNVANETEQKREFNKNNGFVSKSSLGSGDSGNSLLFWASGREAGDSASAETIEFAQYNGFTDTYSSPSLASANRTWNWVSLCSPSKMYFILGSTTASVIPYTSPTNQNKLTINVDDMSVATDTFTIANYKNGASNLQQNISMYDGDGASIYGHYSVYRSAWRDSTGYFARNDGVGPFFRIKSFYKTEGTTAEVFQNIRKVNDIGGTTKLEGQLAPLSLGVYFFNNSGSISVYSPSSGVWTSGGPGANSISFRALQDSSSVSFDSTDQPMLVASDGDKRAYLSFDYSENSFLRFNETDTTFSSLGARPAGQQWQLQIY